MLVNHPDKHYDIIIIGAGMVGASFAGALQNHTAEEPVSILIVESANVAASDKNLSPSFDDRTTALSFGSSHIFRQIGCWEPLRSQAVAINDIHVSDRGHFGSATISRDHQHIDALGYVVQNRELGQALNRSLTESNRIDLLSPAKVELVTPAAEGMRLKLSTGSGQFEVMGKLVVLADGGRSPVCSQLGISTESKEYGQFAVVTNLAFEKSHANIAYERFTESGPLAILPLNRMEGMNRGALIWTVSHSDIDRVMNLDDSEFLRNVQQLFGYRLGRMVRAGNRNSFPLRLHVAKEQIRPGLVLLGNVAHTLHPVAGQGFNLALRDTESLACTIGDACRNRQSPGDMLVLQKFLQQRERDQYRTIQFSDYLTRLFSNNKPGLVWARKFGLASIDLVPVLKRSFAMQAMGLADR